MPLFELTREALTPLARTTLSEHSFREREDLQRLLKQSSSLLGESLYILAEEFSPWADSNRRIDLLAIDREAALVIVELKRSEDGGQMELQALRYAAMISTLTFEQAVAAHAAFLGKEDGLAHAETAILNFLGQEQARADFGKSVRILLVSAGFSKELTTTVLWLNSTGRLDIRCVRLRPYELDGRVLLEVEQIIPLREAQEYTTRIKEKQDAATRSSKVSNADFTHYDLTIDGVLYPNLWKRRLIHRVLQAAAQAGLTWEQLTKIVPHPKMVVVNGSLRGDAFRMAAEAARVAAGRVFRPNKLFLKDDQLINVEGRTIALSTQWGLDSLPIVDELILAVPQTAISYQAVSTSTDEEES